MFKSPRKIFILLLILTLAVSACGQLNSNNAAAPTPTPYIPEATHTPYASLTPTPYTQEATHTPYVPIEGETGSLNQVGPWLVFITGSRDETNQNNQLWAANPDGSGRTLVAKNFFNSNTAGSPHPIPMASPAGGHIAYIAPGADGLTPELHIVSLPSIMDQTITPLYDPDNLQDIQATQDVILNKTNSMAWSPDGTRLAFIGALEGETADLYLFDIPSGTITRMAEIPGQAYMPVWSQDGEWIMYSAASEFPSSIGTSLQFFKIDGIWAVRADQSEVRELSGAVEEPNFLLYQPWYGSHFLVGGFGSLCEANTYCWLDVENNQITAMPYQLVSYSLSPTSGEILLIDRTAAEPAPIIYITPDEPEGRQITTDLTNLQWMPEAQAFAAKSESQSTLQVEIISNGEILSTTNWPDFPLQYIFLAASPDGQHFGWYSEATEYKTGLWLGNQNLAPVFTGEVQDVIWAADSSGLFFTSQNYTPSASDTLQGVYYTPADGSYLQVVKEIDDSDYTKFIGWCGE